MPNSVKYNTESEANALRVGNMHIGTGDVPKGPTSSTGFYNGINPPNGGYTIYLNKSTQGPSIYTPSSDAELISVTNGIAGASYTTINECFNYFAGQSGKFVLHNPINFTVTNGLVLNLNANILPSYPRSGTSWKGLSGESNNGVLTNSPTFNSNGYIDFDGVDDYINTDFITGDFYNENGDWTINSTHNVVSNVTSGNSRSGISVNQRYKSESDPGGFGINIISGKYCVNLTHDDGNGNKESYEALVQIPIDYGKIEHITAAWNNASKTINMYRNGELENTSTSTNYKWSPVTVSTRTHKLATSTQGGWGYYFPMEIASSQIYNRTLTLEEIKQNYHQAPIVTDGLVFAVDAGNLVSYESGSTTAYSLTGSADGTLNNGVGFSSDNGGTWEFDGTDDLINFGVTNNIFTNDTFATIECWFKSSDNGAGTVNNGCIIGTRVGKNMMLCKGTNGIAKYLYDTTTNGNQQVFGTTDVFDQEWHYIVGVFNNGATIIYIDGVSEGTGTSTAPLDISTSHDFGVGGDPQNVNRQVYGQVAIGRVYSKALTAEEVQQNYNAQINRFN